jgi:hypothetical protein
LRSRRSGRFVFVDQREEPNWSSDTEGGNVSRVESPAPRTAPALDTAAAMLHHRLPPALGRQRSPTRRSHDSHGTATQSANRMRHRRRAVAVGARNAEQSRPRHHRVVDDLPSNRHRSPRRTQGRLRRRSGSAPT